MSNASPQIKVSYVGGTALAKETGLSTATVSKHMKAGKSPDEIRRMAAARNEMLKRTGRSPMGMSLDGRPKPGVSRDQAPELMPTSRSSYVPPRSIPRPAQAGVRTGVIGTIPAVPAVAIPVPVTVDDPTADRDRDPDAYTIEDAIADHAKAEEFNDAKVRRMIALADEKELQNAKARGELVPVEHIKLWGTRFLVQAKEMMLKGPGELQDHLAGESNPGACNALVRGWVERVIAELRNLETLWSGEGGDETKVA